MSLAANGIPLIGPGLALRSHSRACASDVALELGNRVTSVDHETATVCLATDGSAADVLGVLDEIDPHRTRVARFAVNGTTLDDVFMQLTGHGVTKETVDA